MKDELTPGRTIFPEDYRKAFEPGAGLTKDFAARINDDGLVKRPDAALHFILRHCGVR